MPIQSGDVKLLRSAIMSDAPESGGAPTGNEIPDGVSNAIFPDISELDRAGGRVNLRKTFVGVHTNDTDTYFGANVIVADPPDDPRVSVTLFSTGRTFDTRAEAQSRIESYLNKGPEWPGYLYENHIQGQRAIQLFQRPSDPVPNVGQTLVLIENEGKSTQKEQYVRITSVSSVIRTFSYLEGGTVRDYQAAIVTCEISDALRFDFTGAPANRFFWRSNTVNGSTVNPDLTKLRDTVVADAGSYVGAVKLAQAANLGDFTVKADGIFSQIVPSAQTETPITDGLPYASAALPVPGASTVTYSASHTWDTNITFSLPGGCLPGSLSISTGGTTITDDAGVLKTPAGPIGTIDYANGLLRLTTGSYSSTKNITYKPAAYVMRAPQSAEIAVTQETRSQSYTGFVLPLPQPGTLSISYMAQGRWYTLSDAGNGQLRGLDSAYGAGTFNSNTGSFVVTLGALPDVGSAIIVTWNAPTQETSHPTETLQAAQVVTIESDPDKLIQPGSMTLTWTQDGTRTATVGANGTISGDATGFLLPASGTLTFIPNNLPAPGTVISVSYTAGPKKEDSFAHPARNGLGQVPVTATLGAVQPGSLEIEWNTFTDVSVLGLYTREQLMEMGVRIVDPVHVARDNGSGQIVLNGNAVGTVNYSTGEVVFNPDVVIKIPRPVYAGVPVGRTGKFRLNYSGMEYVNAASLYPNDTSGYVKLRYNAPGSANTVNTQFTFSPSISLTPGILSVIVPGSVVLRLGTSAPWGDSGTGELREFTTSGWLTRGTIDYATGLVTLSNWTAGTANSFSRLSCVSTVGSALSSEFVFRTATAPLRPGSFSVQFARASGGTQVLTANTSGVISATGVSGTVDHETGIVRLRFGRMVSAAGNESEPWYAADNVSGDQVWKPEPVSISTLRYNAVAYSYLPLDASLIGIDPVRLPSDGRVPIFRKGGFAVVGHTGEIGPITVSNGQTINCGRVRLSRVRVVGNNGAVINTGYTADLEAGTVTFNDVSGYSQPVRIQHRIEDMGVISDVQINGDVTFTRPLTHDYPANTSYVSSALVAGDLYARVSLVFDQVSWNGTWSDSVVGSPATANFNSTVYPITVTNRGAITERWIVRFTNTTSFEVIGENVGVIATGNTATDCSPINPATGVPYFTIPALGWGSGWSTGNVLRFNTIGAMYPVWVVRTVQQGPETVPDDSFTLLIRGDVDTP